jgi:hypothetical protein
MLCTYFINNVIIYLTIKTDKQLIEQLIVYIFMLHQID